MGWTYYPEGVRNPRQEIINLCTGEDHEPVEVGVVNKVYYVAVRFRRPPPAYIQPDADGSWTIAFVILTDGPNKKNGWGYKDMDETSGPYESRAPKKVLKALSRLIDDGSSSYKYAFSWRQFCWTYHARPKASQLKEGDVIRVPSPINFMNGHSYDTFKVTKDYANRRRYLALPGGTTCLIRSALVDGYTLLSRGEN